MCGIAGIWDFDGSAADVEASLRSMTDAIAHRGPDGVGQYLDKLHGLALGHRRLAIIDLSDTGMQPMVSRNGRWAVAFNGEIYNFRALREELQSAGVAFRGASDTEVLVEALARWGIDRTVGRIAGMFAIAAWERPAQRLHLVRDRFGEKPLHYATRGRRFAFASELKAMMACGMADRGAIDRVAVGQFLRYGCIAAPRTVFQSVHKVRPAHIVTVEATGDVTSREYWSLPRVVAERQDARRAPRTLDENVERLDAQMRAIVREQMVADVPLGALLSGGVDSSAVVAAMVAASSRTVRTFAIGFREQGFDEAGVAREVAAHLGTFHTDLYVTADEALGVIPLLPRIFDEPFADASQIPTYLVSHMARQHVTVALSGDGGDEGFGGYARHLAAARLQRAVRVVPLGARRAAAAVLRAVPHPAWDAAGRIATGVLRRDAWGRAGDKAEKLALALAATDARDLYDRIRAPGAGAPLAADLGDVPEWRNEVSVPPTAGLAYPEEMMLADALSYLSDDVLVKVDRAAMAASLEVRAPFLDHRLVELAWEMPLEHKILGRSGKRVLRRVLQRYLPERLIDRPKMGFSVPIGAWLRGPLREWAESLLAESSLGRHALVDVPAVRRTWRAHLDGGRGLDAALWHVLMLQSWLAEWSA